MEVAPGTAIARSTDVDDSGAEEGYHFVAVYASIASLIWYVYSFRMAHIVGWQQSMMDVVHEVGSETHNLNLYNVGVADAKQTCCHSAMAVHTSRKGHVFEATSACLHAAAEYVWEHLGLIESVCREHQFPLRKEFILPDHFFPSGDLSTSELVGGAVHLGIDPTDAYQRKVANGVDSVPFAVSRKGKTVELRMAFPTRPADSASYFPEVTPIFAYYGAVTDGDFTMWRRHVLHVPYRHFVMLDNDPLSGSMGLRYCDRHKVELIRKHGTTAFQTVQKVRGASKESRVAYDKKHALGKLMERTWSANFEHVMNVVREHPDPLVAHVFWELKNRKALAMGLDAMVEYDCKNHDPGNITTGIYGQSTFVIRAGAATDGAIRKSGMSFAANCLEAGPNAAAKKALVMKRSLSVILSKLAEACGVNTGVYTGIYFSVRQDYVAQNPRRSDKKQKQRGEEPTGAFFKQMWKAGTAMANDPIWVGMHIHSSSAARTMTKAFDKPYKYVPASWATACVYLPTDFGADMATKMDNYSEYAYAACGNKLKGPRQRINIATFARGHQQNLKDLLSTWKIFIDDPVAFEAQRRILFDGMKIVDARRELADPSFLEGQLTTDEVVDRCGPVQGLSTRHVILAAGVCLRHAQRQRHDGIRGGHVFGRNMEILSALQGRDGRVQGG